MAINQDTLSFIEGLIGATGDISATIQKSAARKGEVLTLRINDIIGATGGEKPLHRRLTDNIRIQEIEQELNGMKDEVDKADIVTQQYLDSIIGDVQLAQEDNVRFREGKKLFTNPEKTGTEDLLVKEVENYMAMQSDWAGTVPSDKKKASARNIENLLIKYGNQKEDFITYFGERVTNDADLYNSISTVETYAKFILQEMTLPTDGSSGVIDDETFNMFREGLFEGNMAALKEHQAKVEGSRNASVRTLIENMDKDFLAYKDFEREKEFRFKDIDIWADTSNKYDHLYSEMTSDERDIVEKDFNNAKKSFNLDYLNPIKVKLEAANRNYKKQTGGLDYTGALFGRGSNVDNANLTLPASIRKDIDSFASNKTFSSLNQQDIKGIYDRLLFTAEAFESRGEDYRQNEEFMRQLEDFETFFNQINRSIQGDDQAKRNKFTSINSVDAYKDIDISKIKALLD